MRLIPVAVCVAVTSTPGISAPAGSATLPLIWPIPCASAVQQLNAEINNTKSRYRIFMFIRCEVNLIGISSSKPQIHRTNSLLGYGRQLSPFTDECFDKIGFLLP